MIDGMTIVSAGHTYPDMAVGLIILGIVLCVAFVVLACVSEERGSVGGIAIGVIGIVLSILMIAKGIFMPEIPTIKVILKPDTDMVELMQRYEVQSIDGQIWELVEKEQTNGSNSTE